MRLHDTDRNMSTYHCPVKLLEVWMAIEAIEDAWNKASRDEEDNSNIVQLVAKSNNKRRMV